MPVRPRAGSASRPDGGTPPPAPARTVGRVARVWRGMPQISAPIATAVSAIRFEKPHSLSYHDRTRAMRPSITLV
jgi:hypothetical protein